MPSQKNRLISNYLVVAFETLHSMQHHNSVKEGFMALKLDMSKAYDRVEWSFLEVIMRKLGFNERWISLLMLCVKPISYSILVNGEPKGFIKPSRVLDRVILFPPFYFSYARRAPWTNFLSSLTKDYSQIFFKFQES